MNLMDNFKQRLKQYWKLNWLRRSIFTAITVIIILVTIPVVIQYSLTHLLVKQGADSADIEDINLNLFNGKLELQKLVFSSQDNNAASLDHLYADLNMLDLISGKVLVHQLNIEGLNASIVRADNGTISINGLKLPDTTQKTPADDKTEPGKDSKSKPLAFGINHLTISQSNIDYQEKDFTLKKQVHNIQLSNLKSWDKTSVTALEVDMELNQAALKLNADLHLFSEVKKFTGHASLDALTITPYAKFYRTYLDDLKGKVGFDTDFNVTMKQSISAKLSSKFTIDKLAVEYKDISQTIDKVTWAGKTTLADSSDISITGNLQLSGSQSKDTKQNYLISSFEQLSIQELSKNGQSVTFDELNIDNLQLIKKQGDERFIALKKLNLQGLIFDEASSQVKVKNLGFAEPDIQLTLSQQKQVTQLEPLLNTISQLKPESQQKPETEPEASEPVNISIAKLSLLNPGSLKFTDLSVSPSYKTQIALNKIDISNISSRENAHFDIALKQADYTSYDLKGDGLVFDPAKFLQMTASIKQLDLPPVTPYTSQTMGYGMKSGVIDSDIELTIKDREIESKVDIKIDSIEVVETDKTTAEQVSSASGMSIDLAISSLKDKKNIIDLELPITGNLDKPDFDLSKVINRALGKAMKSATLSYLKHTLQPFGSLITLYSLVKKAANHISLPPLLFKVNSQDFKADQQELLDKVSKVLNERPGLKIKACGISAKDDQEAIRAELVNIELARLKALKDDRSKKPDTNSNDQKQQIIDKNTIEIPAELIQQKMKDLADSRSAKVKAFLLEQGNLQPNRILNCLSTTSTEDESVPSVELLI